MDGLNDDYDTPWKLAVTRYFPDFIGFYFSHARWRPQTFSYRLFGCEMRLDFSVVKLNDYAGRIADLLADPNPFALVTAAHLLTRKTRGNAARRHAEKWRLTRLLYLRNWDKQSIIDLYFVIDWMMRLPEELEERLQRYVLILERKIIMRHISSMERFGMRKGELSGQVKMLTRLLSARFGYSRRDMRKRLTGASDEQLGEWSVRLLSAATLDDVFRDN